MVARSPRVLNRCAPCAAPSLVLQPALLPTAEQAQPQLSCMLQATPGAPQQHVRQRWPGKAHEPASAPVACHAERLQRLRELGPGWCVRPRPAQRRRGPGLGQQRCPGHCGPQHRAGPTASRVLQTAAAAAGRGRRCRQRTRASAAGAAPSRAHVPRTAPRHTAALRAVRAPQGSRRQEKAPPQPGSTRSSERGGHGAAASSLAANRRARNIGAAAPS